ncbi:hypothetical protein U1Q18_042864, partial [Sarracenia purpurea var. burkii]
ILQRQEQDQLMQIRKLEDAMRTKTQQELWTKIPNDRMAAQQLIPTDHMTTVDYSRFTSFLEFDDSFLTPWNWKPGNVAGEEGETKPEEPRSSGRNGGPKRYISFEPGSFFCAGGVLSSPTQ